MKINGIECEPLDVSVRQILTVSFDPDDDAEIIKRLGESIGTAVEINGRDYFAYSIAAGLSWVEFEFAEA